MGQRRIFVFLDIDGVLNTSSQWKRMYRLDDGCVSRFVAYIKSLKSDVRVILTSSWKNGFDPAGNHTPQIKTLVDRFAADKIPIFGKTESRADGDRAQEINDYIASHRLENDKCIVIDDDVDIFRAPLAKNCTMVLTDARIGFQIPSKPSGEGNSLSQRIVRFLGRA